MTSAVFNEKFKHKFTVIGRAGELDMNNAKPVMGAQEGRSHFHYAATSIIKPRDLSPVLPEPQSPEKRKDDHPVFAKPIKLAMRVLGDCYSEFADQVITTPASIKAASDTGMESGHHVTKSIDFSAGTEKRSNEKCLLPRPAGHRRKGSVPVQDAKPRLVDFVPYTLEDYRKIRPKKYVVLGGIGPKNPESEDWKRSHYYHKRRVEYAQEIKAMRCVAGAETHSRRS